MLKALPVCCWMLVVVALGHLIAKAAPMVVACDAGVVVGLAVCHELILHQTSIPDSPVNLHTNLMDLKH